MPQKYHNFLPIGFLKAGDKFFISLPLNTLLIFLFCLVCIWAISSSVNSIFYAGWFILYLSYLGFVMLYCSLRRIPPFLSFYFYPAKELEDYLQSYAWFGNNFAKKEVLSFSCLKEERDKKLAAWENKITKYGYRKREFLKGGKDNFFYEKDRFSIFGSYIVHLAVAIILLAAVITFYKGKTEDLNLSESKTVILPGTNTSLTLEKFSVIETPDSSVAEEYISRLRINKVGRPVEWHNLKVNHPLKIAGFKLYQMRYSWKIERLSIAVLKDSASIATIETGLNKRNIISDLGMAIEVKDFIPDFAIDKDGKVLSRSNLLKNPACFIEAADLLSGETVFSGWIFRNFFAPHNYRFAIGQVSIRYVSGIKLVKNPAELITIFGWVVLAIGTFLSSHKFYRRLLLKVEEGEENKNVFIRVYSFYCKNNFEFEWELKKIFS